MPQEFLASFAVDIDESGVNRLQLVLQQNRDLAQQVSAAFDQAKSSMDKFLGELSDDHLSKISSFLKGGKSSGGETEVAAAPEENLSARDRVKNTLLGELLLGENSERGYALDTLLLSTVAQGTRNSTDLRNLPKRSDYGLPAASEFEDSEDYASFQYQAEEILRAPVAEARKIMQQALDAEAQGLDTKEYTDKVIEILRDPLQQVRDLYDTMAPETSGEDAGLSGLSEKVDAFLQETAKKKLTFDTSSAVAQARSVLSAVRAMFTSASIPLNIQASVSGILAGGLLTAVQGTAGRAVTNNNANASVNISVTSSGADPVAVGQSIYNTAEQYLLRTLQSS